MRSFSGDLAVHTPARYSCLTRGVFVPSSFAYHTMVTSPPYDALSAIVQKLCPWTFKSTQVEVADGKAICPDPDERTTGVSCVQIYLVGKLGKEHESLDMNARKSGYRHFHAGTVWTYRLSVWNLNLGMALLCSISAASGNDVATGLTSGPLLGHCRHHEQFFSTGVYQNLLSRFPVDC